jgi:hypothetical protein
MSNAIRRALLEERRKRFLTSLINEAIINVLAEQEQAAGQEASMAELPAAPATSPVSANTQSPPDNQTKQLFTVDSMIERLNVIRGGRSFTDPEVYGRLVTYFKTLDDDSKDRLESFLIELGKIVIDVGQEPARDSGNTQGAAATTGPAPSPSPAQAQAPAMPPMGPTEG